MGETMGAGETCEDKVGTWGVGLTNASGRLFLKWLLALLCFPLLAFLLIHQEYQSFLHQNVLKLSTDIGSAVNRIAFPQLTTYIWKENTTIWRLGTMKGFLPCLTRGRIVKFYLWCSIFFVLVFKNLPRKTKLHPKANEGSWGMQRN